MFQPLSFLFFFFFFVNNNFHDRDDWRWMDLGFDMIM